MLETVNFSEIKSSYFKEKTAVVIGFFDGVHKGHADIIKKCVARSIQTGQESLALTFNKPPRNIISGKKEKKLIISFKEKTSIIHRLGIKKIVTVDFDKHFAELSPYQFCEEIIKKKLNAAEIFIGENFKFGKDVLGNARFLTDFFAQSEIKVNVIELLKINGITVSSTEIRKYFKSGDIDNIKLFMGRYPIISGKVIRGFSRGGKFGFPTANIELDEKYMIPRKGVYFARIKIQGIKHKLPCVVNIGNNPTFNVKKLLLEAHIIEFNENIYGKLIKVELIRYHRPELKFTKENQLIVQIKSDIKEGIEFFAVKNYNDKKHNN
jgi:riboflavin kinase/FMN adenylyltransferase